MRMRIHKHTSIVMTLKTLQCRKIIAIFSHPTIAQVDLSNGFPLFPLYACEHSAKLMFPKYNALGKIYSNPCPASILVSSLSSVEDIPATFPNKATRVMTQQVRGRKPTGGKI